MKTKIMGILNLTPDSYYNPCITAKNAVSRVKQMLDNGVDIIDIGAESTRPFSTPVSEDEELERLEAFFDICTISFPFSIDTYKPKVAEYAISKGATMINDISGFSDDEMCALAASSDVMVCLMHNTGSAKTRHKSSIQSDSILQDILSFFKNRIDKLKKFGVKEDKIILDPGIGFGMNNKETFEIFRNLPSLSQLGYPLLIGASRKSFLQRELKQDAKDLLHATLVINTIAAISGAQYLRVHDVKEHKELAHLVDCVKGNNYKS